MNIQLLPSTAQKPIFIRLPKKRCPYSSLSRSSLLRFIYEPSNRIETLLVKVGKSRKGLRLIHFDSLINALRANQIPRKTIQQVKNSVPASQHHLIKPKSAPEIEIFSQNFFMKR